MRRLISKAWRTFGSGLSFALFGAAGLIVGVVLVPFVHWLSPSREVAQLRVQRIVQLAFRSFLSCVRWLGVADFRLEGRERLRPGSLVVANHPTLLDAVAVIAAMPQCYCIVKQANFRNVFMRSAARAAGYVSNSGGVAMVEECVELLREGRSLLLFPEGTRSPAEGMGDFRRGWAHIALRAGCDPVPVMITCDPPTLRKGQKWYDIPDRKFHLTVRVDEPLSVRDIVRAPEPRGKSARALNAALREHFEKGLERADVG